MSKGSGPCRVGTELVGGTLHWPAPPPPPQTLLPRKPPPKGFSKAAGWHAPPPPLTPRLTLTIASLVWAMSEMTPSVMMSSTEYWEPS